MGDESNRSSDALQGTGGEDSEPVKRGRADHRDEKLANKREKERVSSESWSDCTRGNSSRKESKTSELKTLASEQLSEAALADFDESSHLLTEVPVEYSLQPLQSVEKLKEQAKAVGGKSHKSVTGTSSEVPTPFPNVTSKLEVSPAFVAKSDISIPNSLLVKNENSKCFLEQDKQNSPGSNSLSNGPIRKISDGYNWRKYGQKQVKSPKGSRSYYKCTFSDCCAKKIECCDPSNHLIETVYRSHHNHDPPQKLNCTKESLPASPVGPVSGDNDSFHPVIYSNDPVKDNKLKQSIQGTNEIPGTEKHESSDSDETTEVNMEEYVDGVESIKRQKTNSAADMESPSKPVEKSKCIVHAAGDMGISGDGYRWRKYGQKMVKGNPHPRNYYKCTSAGCPVRKLIERAVDNTNAVVITYKGTHDHGLPVQRKCDGPKSSVVADSCLTSDENQAKQLHNRQTQWSVDKGCELTGGPSNVSGEKASDSARTLVDFGFEIRPC